MSNLQYAIWTLREFNLWRRSDEDMEQPDPREIGKAIDTAIEAMEELNEWRTLMSWGGTPEIINEFIKGQQSRIYAAQDAEEQRDRLEGELTETRGKIELSREWSAAIADITDDLRSKLAAVTEQRDEAREYADKLAQGLPDGMLPKDIEVLREANLGLATEVTAVTEQRDRLAEALERILSYQGRFCEEDPESIAAEALAALKGGSDERR